MVFKMYASCQIVQGFKRSLISDLFKHRIQLIPNDLANILIENFDKSLQEIKNKYDNKYSGTIDEYFKFLVDKEYGFFTDEPERFPKMMETFRFPAHITNAVLDINKSSLHDYTLIIDKLNEIGCVSLDIRIFEPINKKLLKNIFQAVEESRLRSLRLIIPASMKFSLEELNKYCDSNARIQAIYLHSAEKNLNFSSELFCVPINLRKQKVASPATCGFVDEKLMVSNIQAFMESKKFNNCLNKKLSIDTEGNIKNCSQMNKEFGNIHSSNIVETVNSESFQKLWKINKDQIKICQDCEYRYNCIDCRAILTDEQDPFSKPKHCSYDPYNATWM